MSKRLLFVMLLSILLITGCEFNNFTIKKPTLKDAEVETTIPNYTEHNTTQFETLEYSYEIYKRLNGNLTVYLMDVPGSPMLIVFPGNSTMLVNAGDGSTSTRIYNYVRNLGFRKIDYLVLQNYNSYRFAGASFIINKLEPKYVFDRGGATNTKYFFDYIDVVKNRTSVGFLKEIEIDHVNVKLIPPFEGSGFYDEEGMNSLLLHLSYGDKQFLHLGDCISECENILDEHRLTADIFVAGKNGDCDGTSTFMLNIINPDIVIFDNSINEPCKEVLLRTEYLGIGNYQLKPRTRFFWSTDGTI